MNQRLQLRIELGAIKLKAVIAVVTCFILAGCNSGSKAAMDLIAKRNVVVLKSHSIVLIETPIELKSSKPMEISGSLSSICFVLKNGVTMQDMKAMDRIFADAIGEANINTALVLSNGDRVVLSRPSFSWSEDGVILKSGELAACAAPPCGVTLPIGATVSKVEASSAPGFHVRGIYWKSERDPSEPLLPSVSKDANSQSKSKKGCSSAQ